MIVGSPTQFAIESVITKAFSEPGSRALGFFVLHIAGECYGVRAPDASLLACSLDEVEAALSRRGSHISDFARGVEAGCIADAYRDAVYAPDQEERLFFGMPRSDFVDLVCARHLVWAPDGDEAFDDGSYVLRFDVGDEVRLIGFRSGSEYHHDPKTLREVFITADEFYGILQRWRDAFLAEWEARQKEEPNLESSVSAKPDTGLRLNKPVPSKGDH